MALFSCSKIRRTHHGLNKNCFVLSVLTCISIFDLQITVAKIPALKPLLLNISWTQQRFVFAWLSPGELGVHELSKRCFWGDLKSDNTWVGLCPCVNTKWPLTSLQLKYIILVHLIWTIMIKRPRAGACGKKS